MRLWMRIAVALLTAASGLIMWANRRRYISVGEQQAIARQLREIALRTGIAREVENEVTLMSDDEIERIAYDEGWVHE